MIPPPEMCEFCKRTFKPSKMIVVYFKKTKEEESKWKNGLCGQPEFAVWMCLSCRDIIIKNKLNEEYTEYGLNKLKILLNNNKMSKFKLVENKKFGNDVNVDDIFCTIKHEKDEFSCKNMDILRGYILGMCIKEFTLDVCYLIKKDGSLCNNDVVYIDSDDSFKKICSTKHSIDYEIFSDTKVNNKKFKYVIDYYNNNEEGEMCLLKDFTCKQLLHNYIKFCNEGNIRLSEMCLFGSNIGNCVVIHNQDCIITDCVWVNGEEICFNTSKKSNKYMECIENIINGDGNILYFGLYQEFNLTKEGCIEDFPVLGCLRGENLVFDIRMCEKVEISGKCNCLKNENEVIISTDYETDKNLSFNNGKLKILVFDNIVSVFKDIFFCISKDEDIEVHLHVLLSYITHSLSFEEYNLFIDDVCDLFCSLKDKDFKKSDKIILDKLELMLFDSKNNLISKTFEKIISNLTNNLSFDEAIIPLEDIKYITFCEPNYTKPGNIKLNASVNTYDG